MNNEKRNNETNGITLIALVITIILMLILAGVVLNLTIGERGIFNTAKSTKDIQKIAEYKDNVEISRTGVAVDNLGKVTLDNLIEEIYKDKIVPEGSIEKLNETQGKMTTEEGYVFIITADGIEYIDKEENIPNPELKEGTITFSIKPEGWTKENIKVSINKNTEENLTLKYSLDKLTWSTYTEEIEIGENRTVYACLENIIGEQGSHANIKVTKIDKLEPKDFTPSIKTSTNSIEIDASRAEDEEANKKYGKSGIKEIWYSKDNGVTWQTNEDKKSTIYKYEGLIQNTKHNVQVKVIDVAGNETITQTQKVTTGTVTVAEGNITINAPTWNGSTHKASVTITKGSSVASGLSIQYQVNSVAGTWQTGTSVSNLNLNDTVYARLWDGTNGGSYTSLKITEKIAPTVTVNITGTSTNSITASVTSSDAQAGIPSSPTYVFYIKKTSEADTAYVQKQSSTSSRCTFTGLTQNTSYTVKVTTKDIAGNTGSGTKAGSTGTVTVAEGNITINAPTWNASTHKASVTITKGSSVASGLSIQYQVNSVAGTWQAGTSVTNLNLNDIVYARLWDGTNGGNYTSLKITEKVVPTKPTLAVSSGTKGENGYYRSNVIVTVNSGSDAQSGVSKTTVTLSGATSKKETTIANGGTITIANEGTTTITAYTYDKANNKSKATTLTIKKDTIAPTINLVQTDTTTLQDTKTVNVNITDASGLSVWKWDYGNRNLSYFASSGQNFNSSFTVKMQDYYDKTKNKNFSNVVCTVYAKDFAGNDAIATINIVKLKVNIVFTYNNGLQYNNGGYVDNGRINLPTTEIWQYGPYIGLPAGSYMVTWDGYYINDIWTDIAYDGGGILASNNPCVTNGNGQPYMTFNLGGVTGGIEFRCAPLGHALPVGVDRVTLTQTN